MAGPYRATVPLRRDGPKVVGALFPAVPAERTGAEGLLVVPHRPALQV